MESNQLPEIRWYEGDCEHRAGWRSEAGVAPHADIRIADDRTGADDAYRLLEAGTALLWRGDWVNARHLMQALTKRADRRFGAPRGKAPKTPAAGMRMKVIWLAIALSPRTAFISDAALRLTECVVYAAPYNLSTGSFRHATRAMRWAPT